MTNVWLWLCRATLAVLLVTGAASAWAQATPAEPARQPAANPASEQAAGGDAALQALIRALEDPAARARLLDVLRAQAPPPTSTTPTTPTTPPPSQAAESGAAEPEAQAEAQASGGVSALPGMGLPGPSTFGTAVEGSPAEGPPAATEAKPKPPAETMIAKALDSLRGMVAGLVRFTSNAVDIFTLWRWMQTQASTDETRAFWADFLTAIIVTLAVASAVYWAVRLGLHRIHRRLRERVRTAHRHRRLRTGLVLTLMELAPIVSFWLIAYSLIGVLDFPLRTELVAQSIAVIAADALLFVGLARIVLRPHTPYLRVLALDDELAADLYRTLRWLILWTLLGYAVFSNITNLRVPPGVFEGLERIWGLVILITAMTVVLRYRNEIGEAIAGDGGRFLLLRRFLAQIWLPAMILYGISAYLVWALEVYQGAELLMRGGILSVVVLLAVQPVSLMLSRWVRFVEDAETSGPAAILLARLERYTTLLRWLLSLLVYVAAAIAIGYAWGLDPLAWLGAHFSGRFVATLGDIAFVTLVCWGLWEAFDLWFRVYLDSVDETGARVKRSARSRTLLPLLRTSVLVLLVIAFLVAALTRLGLDVAPLLATAGVVGIAVGFGAQKLVQDVITGLFMLFQNTVSVGDVVSLGGYTGTVERITVRTLELRDLEGSLHTIPFSGVTTVTNMTRDFAYALFDIGVAYKEDTATVIEVLRQVGAEFELDPTHGPDLLSALEMFGVQQLGDSAVTIRCRFRVRPLTQWAIQRAFLGRVKQRFDELGIEIPFPQRTLHMVESTAPAAPRVPDDTPEADTNR